MEQDGWWWTNVTATNKSIRRQILREMLADYRPRLGRGLGTA
jgi:hypothetical protein